MDSREKRGKIEKPHHVGAREQVKQKRDEKEGQRTDDDDLMIPKNCSLQVLKKDSMVLSYGFYLMIKKKI